MEVCSACSGPCETCVTHFIGGCLAGHGDDEYIEATPEWIAGFRAGYRTALIQYKYRDLPRGLKRDNPFSTSGGVDAELRRIREASNATHTV